MQINQLHAQCTQVNQNLLYIYLQAFWLHCGEVQIQLDKFEQNAHHYDFSFAQKWP